MSCVELVRLVLQMIVFSDTNDNVMYAWNNVSGIQVWRTPSGRQTQATTMHAPLLEPGSNGLLYHAPSRSLLMCDHGRRQIMAMSHIGTIGHAFHGGNNGNSGGVSRPLVAAAPNGGRFNSPNDLSFTAEGDLYFTDPAYGMRSTWGPDHDAIRDLSHNCIYRAAGVHDALMASVTDTAVDVSKLVTVSEVSCDMKHPNGVAVLPSSGNIIVSDSSRLQSYWKVSVCVCECIFALVVVVVVFWVCGTRLCVWVL